MIIFHQRVSIRKITFILLCVCLFIFVLKLYLYVNAEDYFRKVQIHINTDDVRQLLRAGVDNGVTIILYDPIVLQAWNSKKYLSRNKSCIFLCQAVGPLSFAVIAGEIKQKSYFLARLAQFGFTVTKFLSDKDEISHIYLTRSGSVLHLSVLHWSNAGYWRQYVLSGSSSRIPLVNSLLAINTTNILYMDATFEQFDTKKVVIDGFSLRVPKDIIGFLSNLNKARYIYCNESRARVFNLRFPVDDLPEIKRFQHLSWKILAKSVAVLDKLEIPFWLSSGTLLGFFRQCSIIPWSLDVDLGIFIKDYSPHLISAFENAGLAIVHQFGKIEDSFELSFKENGVKLDIFFFYLDGDVAWNGGTQVKTGNKFKYSFSKFDLCWTEFLDLRVRIPCQTEQYIEANYGQNWFQAIKEWNWKSDPSNVQSNGVWNSEELSKVIVIKDS